MLAAKELSFHWEHLWDLGAVLAAAFVGGMANVIAGGGSLITFPTLLLVGLDPVVANATNTVALWPGSLSGVYGFRTEIREAPRAMYLLLIPSVVGGTLGAIILLRTPGRTFEVLAPFLVLTATALLAFQEPVSRLFNHQPQHSRSRRWWILAVLTQTAVAVYGGFFGAGIGILILANLGLMGLTDIHRMNGLKNLYATGINGAALVYFVMSGAVVWVVVLVMVVGAIIGGVTGAVVAHRVGRRTIRIAIVTMGFILSTALIAKNYSLW
ncbi:MAG: sulfite exporter TauE/SafE family protein [Actinomycetota bacterium]